MRSLSQSRPRRAFALGALIAVAVALALVAPVFALLVAPALLLAAFLIVGFFPGEALLQRKLASHHESKPGRSTSDLAPDFPSFVRRTGRRIAFALAVRPPPTIAPPLPA